MTRSVLQQSELWSE